MKIQLRKLLFWIKMHHRFIIAFLALILSIFGTLLIWIDSRNSINALAELLRETTSTVGFWQTKPISQENFNQSLQNAANLNIKGFILLMAGFGMQIINLFISKQNNNTEV
ncbi:MAG: hypothetical protein ACOCWG_01040 [bacterium]